MCATSDEISAPNCIPRVETKLDAQQQVRRQAIPATFGSRH